MTTESLLASSLPPPPVIAPTYKGLMPGWLAYLLAGLLASVMCFFMVSLAVGVLEIPFTEEYLQLVYDSDMSMNPQAMERLAVLHAEHQFLNYRQFLTFAAVATASMFGVGAGVAAGRFGRVIKGLVVGTVCGALLGWFVAAGVIMVLQQIRVARLDSLVAALVIHGTSWSVIVLALAVTVGIVQRSWRLGGQALLFGMVAAGVGVAVSVLGGASLEKFNVVEQLIMDGKYSLMMWACLPPLLTGLFLARGAAHEARAELELSLALPTLAPAVSSS